MEYNKHPLIAATLRGVAKGARVVKSGKIRYINIPCSFDIETSSFYESGEKRATMYVWMLDIDGIIITGRTWYEFTSALSLIRRIYNVSCETILVCYVHNLSFEFAFMAKWFEWYKVFALDSRKPVYARTVDGIEFRCSYILSGYALENLSTRVENLNKRVGDLDYSKMRHSKTPLTVAEWGYCYRDVEIVTQYIREQIEDNGDITKIPLTKTGFVRRYCRNACLFGGGGTHKGKGKYFRPYRKLMNELTMTAAEYEQLQRAFAGGFTHASAWKSGKLHENVTSYDEISAYPAVMLCELYPMSAAELIDPIDTETFEYSIDNYCCLFDVTFENIRSTQYTDHPLSASKCFLLETPIEDNGRIVSAAKLSTTITDVDFNVFSRFYEWDAMQVRDFRRYIRGHLPKVFMKSVLKLYEDKTTLKGVKEKELEYSISKGMLNAAYGMAVTSPTRPEYEYDGHEWQTPIKPDTEIAISKYNKSMNRFLFYPWGVWVTAYARRNIFTAIDAIGDDYIYADTDSVKIINAERHEQFFEWYNARQLEKVERALSHYKLPFDMGNPATQKGERKLIGAFECDGVYTKFKTLGAKRYAYIQGGKFSITVSGLNKKVTAPYLLQKYGERVFDAFADGLYIPPQFTGKMTHSYSKDDEEYHGMITDYQNVTNEYYEKGFVHLEPADYSLSIYRLYAEYLAGIQEISE